MSKISNWLSKIADSFKKIKDDTSEAVDVAATLSGEKDPVRKTHKDAAVDVAATLSGEKDPVRKTHKDAAVVDSHIETVKGPFMLPVSKTMKRKFSSREVQVKSIDWRSLERNKYAPWGVGKNAVAHV